MKFIVICFVLIILFAISTHPVFAQDTIQVNAGWNIIGAKSTTPRNSLITEPSGIITSSYFGYTSGVGYSQPDTLQAGTGFWVKTSQAGILINPTVPVNPCPRTVNYGSKTYLTVLLGQQCWLQQNLDIGTMINSSQTQTDNSTIEKYCFNDLPVNCTMYGGLYSWNEAMIYTTIESSQGICPPEWHIPSVSDIEILTAGISDGNLLKAVGQGIGYNTSGFSALLAGAKYSTSGFADLTTRFNLWSSTDGSAGANGFYLALISSDANLYYSSEVKNSAFSIRCLKN